MVTAELALGTGAVVLTLAAGLQALSLGIDQVRCVDAAHVAARAAARGDPLDQVRALAAGRAPQGSAVTVAVGEWVVVQVVAPRTGPVRWLAEAVGAHAEATVPVERGGHA
ncbi:TadE family type IV pilus minor pilin [Arsenicicoccus dermatophilus]|uniref:TadE family type IV pilus minor pilin n=1 Tax=Arsenicicoccus dermatophilus TaxID=1076331 RepID=UPI003916CF7B